MDIAYRNFVLSISSVDRGERLRVSVSSPEGEASETLALPPEFAGISAGPPDSLQARRAEVGNPFRDLFAPSSKARAPDLRELGGLLFRTFFRGQIRQLYDRSAASSSDPSSGLRIQIRFDGEDPMVAALAELPWELLYQAETRDFLGRRFRNPIVRYVQVPRATGLPPFDSPLRILLVASGPRDQVALDLERERRLIEQACEDAGSDVEVLALEKADDERLREALYGGGYHVVHFMGHGAFDETRGEGCLLFETEDGLSQRLSGEEVAELLKDHLPRLVVINACESARAGLGKTGDFFSGVATALVMAGTPAVVAMRAPVSDDAAVAFSKRLYRLLVAGHPVDAAVAEARFAIYRTDRNSPEWATPVLFMRVADGKILSALAESSGVRSEETTKPLLSGPSYTLDVDATDSESESLDIVGSAKRAGSSGAGGSIRAKLPGAKIGGKVRVVGECDGLPD